MAGRLSKLDNLAKWLNRFRPWIYRDKRENESFLMKKNELNFTMMSYNILSEDNMLRHPDLYTFCPPDALKWPNRGNRILREIEINNPDILCLQEVYLDHYTDFYTPELRKKGYDAIFNLRESKFDGCALFWKKDKFSLLKSKEITFHRKDLLNILDRPNVALIAMLQPIQTQSHKVNNCLVVGTTHILFNYKRGDIKLAQLRLLLAEIERMALRKVDENGRKSYHPIVIAGDFNLLPGSAIYQFLERGVLDWRCLDYKTMSGYMREAANPTFIGPDRINIDTMSSSTEFVGDHAEDELSAKQTVHAVEQRDQVRSDRSDRSNRENGRTNRPNAATERHRQVSRSNRGDDAATVLTHSLRLKSVFKSMNSQNQPLITTKHDRACEMVDYVFYHQTEELSLVGFRKLLSDERAFREAPYMPNELIGSDHFSLVTKFKLKNRMV